MRGTDRPAGHGRGAPPGRLVRPTGDCSIGAVTLARWTNAAGSPRVVAGIAGLRGSGTDAAVGPERSQVRRLIEQPESLPLVSGLAQVLRIH
jgi:hypothetical protein